MIPENFLGCEAKSIPSVELDRAIDESSKPDLGTG